MSANPAIGVDDAVVHVEATANLQANFAFDFPIYTVDQLEVSVNGNAPLAPGYYTVNQVENALGGVVTLNGTISGAILDGDIVTIRRVTPIARNSKYGQVALFRSYTVNRDFDLLIMIAQELRREDGALSDAIEAEAIIRALADARLEGIINAMITFEAGDNTLGGLTRAAIPAITIPPAVSYLRTIGESAPDEGPADNAVAGAIPAHGNYVDDLAGRHFAFNSRTQTLYTVGKVVATEIKAKLDELNTKGGGELIIKDEHIVAGAVAKTDFASDLILNFDEGRAGKLKLGAGLTTPILLLRSIGYTGRLTVIRPQLDCSEGVSTPGAGTSTGLAAGPWEHLHVERGIFTAGRDPTANKGDSGISSSGCLYARVADCYFEGWSDAGIYCNGGALADTSDDGHHFEIINCNFERNTWCVTAKRQLAHLSVIGGSGLENLAGIGTFEVSAALTAARQVDIVGFTAKKFASRVLELNGPSKAKIVGLSLIDWGYDPLDPPTIQGSNPSAIQLNGVDSVIIENLLLAMEEWNGAAAHFGIIIANQTVGSGTYTGGRHFIDGEIRGVFRAVSEGAGVDASRFNLRLRDFTQLHGASQPAASVYEVSNNGAKKTLEVGSQTYIQPNETAYRKTSGALLSSVGTLAATTTSSVVSIPLVGVLAADIVQLQPLTLAAAQAPQLSYALRAVTDAVEVVVRNNGAVGFDFSAQTFLLTATRRPNV